MKNDYEKLCDKMSKVIKYSFKNPITNAKVIIREYVDGDKDKFLQIKTESKQIVHTMFVSDLFGQAGFAAALLSLIVDIMDTTGVFGWLPIAIGSIILIILIGLLIGMVKFRNVRKYEGYITTAICEIEKEYN